MFTSSRHFHDMLDGVAEVALSAKGGDQEAARWITKGAWQRGRIQQGRCADLPTAETVRRRLHSTWEKAVEVAFTPLDQRVRVLNRLQRTDRSGRRPQDIGGPVTGTQVADARALLAVRHRLGRAPTMVEYDEQIALIHDGRDRMAEGAQIRLPGSAALVNRNAKDWGRALATADLVPRDRPSPRGLTGRHVAETLSRCIDELGGVLPAEPYFRAWCQRTDVSVPRGRANRADRQTWTEVRRMVAELRTARGIPTPTTVTPTKDCPPLPAGPEGGRVITKKKSFTEQDALVSLKRYAELYLVGGQKPRAKHYQAVMARHADLISLKAMQRHGTFQTLCHKAGIL